MREIAWYNGKLTTLEEARISPDDRAFYFGDGIYDVVTVRKGICFALEDHLDRFFTNAERLRLNMPMTKDEVRGVCDDLISKLDRDIEEAALYFQASRATAPRNHAFPENAKANLYFTLKPSKFKKIGMEISAIFEKDIRFLMCDIKTLNLLPNVLAQQKALEAGCYEVIFHRGERVTEGSHSCICMLKDGVFCTPPTDEMILPSITRKHYLQICEKLGIPTRIAPFTRDELLQADEIIVMSTTALMCRCIKINGNSVGGRDGENLRRIADAYRARILRETEGK
ncbi:MAG: D-amino acid aminotransferase [Ruminococcaceae bacterium]|nr:D-amino acid aminotransferase [Oscillospiraceae bacterium]